MKIRVIKREKNVTNNRQVLKRVGQWVKVILTLEIEIVQWIIVGSAYKVGSRGNGSLIRFK